MVRTAKDILMGERRVTQEEVIDVIEKLDHVVLTSLVRYWAHTEMPAHLTSGAWAVAQRGVEWLKAREAFEKAEKRRENMQATGCVACGSRHGDRTTLNWWVLPGGHWTETQMLEALGRVWNVWGAENHSPYDCTGKWLSSGAFIKAKTKTRTLVVQSWYQDI